jgi:hypothetical protein
MRRGRRHWPCPTCPRSEPQRSPNGRQRGEPGPPVTVGYLQPAPGLARPRRPGSADGRGSRPGASHTPRVGAAALAASGSRPWSRRRGGTARPWWRAYGRWPGRRRAAPRTAPAAPRSAGQVQVVPGPHRTSVSNTSSRVDRERCVARKAAQSLSGPRWGRNSAEPGGQQRTAGDNEPRGQQPFRGDAPGLRKRWSELSRQKSLVRIQPRPLRAVASGVGGVRAC